MQFIYEHYKPDLVLMRSAHLDHGSGRRGLCGAHLVKAKNVIPMHYGANPIAYGKAGDFVNAMKGTRAKSP